MGLSLPPLPSEGKLAALNGDRPRKTRAQRHSSSLSLTLSLSARARETDCEATPPFFRPHSTTPASTLLLLRVCLGDVVLVCL